MSKNSLLDRILETSKSPYKNLLCDSEIFKGTESIPTSIPMLNVALSSQIDGGLTHGITMIAGDTKRFKTLFGLHLMSAFQKKYKDGVCIFYDTEAGITERYIENAEVDWKKVIHIPVNSIEILKTELINQIELIKANKNKNDKVFIFIDSIGNLASKKEIDDAIKGDIKVDMTRAKQLKSLFRIITMDINLLKIPLVCINHTYKSQDFIQQDIVGGGSGGQLASDTIWIISRKQEKDGDEIVGYDFFINVWKSRTVKEKISKIPIRVFWKDGIHKFSGLSDLAIELGVVEKTKEEKEKVLKFEDKIVSVDAEDMNADFWNYVLEKSNLKQLINEKYRI